MNPKLERAQINFPSTEFKEVTVEEAFEALKKNGFEHLRSQWLQYSGDSAQGEILGGCALGQMSVNLGVQPTGNEYSLVGQLNRLGGYQQIGDKIISYNDAMDGDGMHWLYSWEEIVEFAERLLKPHFGYILILRVQKFKLPASMEV